MKTLVVVYDSHKEAFNAVNILKEAKFPLEKTSVLGKADVIDEHVHVRSNEDKAIATPVSVGAVAGPILGALAGVGVFAIPGIGLVYGAGAVVGALAGFDLGIIAGAIGSVLTTLGVNDEDWVEKHQEKIEAGKFLLVAQGEEDDLEKAKEKLEGLGGYEDLDIH